MKRISLFKFQKPVFQKKIIFFYLLSIHHKLISIEIDVLIIDFFDVEIRRQITRAKISKRFDIFAIIIHQPIS